MPSNPTKPNHIYLIYMYKEDLALKNLQWLIYNKTQPKKSYMYMYKEDFVFSLYFLYRCFQRVFFIWCLAM